VQFVYRLNYWDYWDDLKTVIGYGTQAMYISCAMLQHQDRKVLSLHS